MNIILRLTNTFLIIQKFQKLSFGGGGECHHKGAAQGIP